ncbi:Spo0B domain-containing protein [Paenibacillus sediminis]|uniref:SpoOB alpha-helical domain-containing protein n=1 Tax=Paenibacillus sediminis TaxID=664909 RepID=A0ABS4H777_9BACL|nr:Spo0B domain-containing protein [Paenibacillus sediminis]MBP1938331.1 hypothetical protein [Paenibacillus sediminis]
MSFWNRIPGIAIVSVLIPLLFAFAVRSTLAYVILFIWMTGVFAFCLSFMRRYYERENKRNIAAIQRTSIKTLGHHRHDWMNELQILYGYIKLGKVDKLAGCVERIKEQMTVESKISKLGIPSLVFYLQSFRASGSTLQLDIRMDDDLDLRDKLTAEREEQLTQAIIDMIRAYQFTARQSWEEDLRLTMTFTALNNEVIIKFDCNASGEDSGVLSKQIDQVVQGKRIKAEQLHPHSASFQLRVPVKI